MEEEIREIEKKEKTNQALNPDNYKSHEEILEEKRKEKELEKEAAEEDSDVEVVEMKNEAVTSEKVKTKA